MGPAQPPRQRAGSQELPGLACITAGAGSGTNLLHLSAFASSPRGAGSYRFSAPASVRSQMSCTASRCLPLWKRGHGAQLPAPPKAGLEGLQANLLQPPWLPGPPIQCPRFSPVAEKQAGSDSQTPAPDAGWCSGVKPSSRERQLKQARSRQLSPARPMELFKTTAPRSALTGRVQGYQPRSAQHPPLPFFSIASTSFTSSGGASSGGLNCSCNSRRGDPAEEGGREGSASAQPPRPGPNQLTLNSRTQE